MTNEIVLYKPNEQLSLEVKVENDTVWLNRNQMAVLFDRDVKTIGKHINNALHEELAPTVAKNATLQKENPTVAKFAIVQQEGDRSVVRQVEYYSLDVILSVGYRVNVRFSHEDVWLNQEQLTEIYCTTQQNVSLHIRNIYTDGELSEEATHKKFLLVRQEGNRNANGWDEWKDANGKTLDEVYRKK